MLSFCLTCLALAKITWLMVDDKFVTANLANSSPDFSVHHCGSFTGQISTASRIGMCQHIPAKVKDRLLQAS